MDATFPKKDTRGSIVKSKRRNRFRTRDTIVEIFRKKNFRRRFRKIYVSSVNIISREEGVVPPPPSFPRVGRGISRGGGLGGIPWSDDTLKNSADICSRQIYLREYSYLRQFSWLRPQPLLRWRKSVIKLSKDEWNNCYDSQRILLRGISAPTLFSITSTTIISPREIL